MDEFKMAVEQQDEAERILDVVKGLRAWSCNSWRSCWRRIPMASCWDVDHLGLVRLNAAHLRNILHQTAYKPVIEALLLVEPLNGSRTKLGSARSDIGWRKDSLRTPANVLHHSPRRHLHDGRALAQGRTSVPKGVRESKFCDEVQNDHSNFPACRMRRRLVQTEPHRLETAP